MKAVVEAVCAMSVSRSASVIPIAITMVIVAMISKTHVHHKLEVSVAVLHRWSTMPVM